MKKIIFNTLSILAASLVMVSCEKTEVKPGGGKTLFKLVEGGGDPIVLALNTDPAVEEIGIATLLRDVANNADYNAAATVTIANSQAVLDAYNDENGTEYELLPTGSYTITAASGVTVNGNDWTVNMAGKELTRKIRISLNKALLDLSKSYAFGLQITNSSVGSPSAGTGTAIINVLIKNEYDGVYEVTGTMVDVTSADFTAKSPMEYHLVTTGAASVAGWDPDVYEDFITPILNAGANSGWGAFSPVFTFNPATHEIVSVTNYYGQPAPSNSRSAEIDNTGENIYDPVTKTIKVKFKMFQPTVVPLPDPRVTFDWTMEYIGPRP